MQLVIMRLVLVKDGRTAAVFQHDVRLPFLPRVGDHWVTRTGVAGSVAAVVWHHGNDGSVTPAIWVDASEFAWDGSRFKKFIMGLDVDDWELMNGPDEDTEGALLAIANFEYTKRLPPPHRCNNCGLLIDTRYGLCGPCEEAALDDERDKELLANKYNVEGETCTDCGEAAEYHCLRCEEPTCESCGDGTVCGYCAHMAR